MSPQKKIQSVAALLVLWLGGCQQILGVDELKGGVSERDAGKDAGGSDQDAEVEYVTPSEEDCAEYCGAIKDTCSAMSKAAFREESYCAGLCPHMLKRKDGSAENSNTFDCRLALVKAASDVVGAGDNDAECKSSGAGGNNMCGSNCEGYCQLFESVCGKYPALTRAETCSSECELLPLDTVSDATAAFSSQSDTLQCRLSHLGAAAAGMAADNEMLRETHCKHAAISVTTEYTPCLTPTPRCEDFCTLMTNACKGDLQQYETFQDCVAICSKGLTLNTTLAPDEPIDISHDTVACRRYHAYNAVKLPTGLHCEHGGPTGDGHCGKICPAYCNLAKAACATDYSTKYTNDAACESECDTALRAEGVADQLDHHYSVPKGKASDADPMQCRVYRLSKAFLAPNAHCAAALGGGDCAP